jgi:ABC-type antimicrobial peptide transport system permease subunit
VIVNETGIALMHYKDPIGKPVYSGNYKMHIVGVVKDFHFQSLHDKIMPLTLHPGRNAWFRTILVRTKPGQTTQALAGLGKLCKQLNPSFPFDYKFSDVEYAALYKSEGITGQLSVIFAILAILISCLGLLGLSLFTAEQRVREIGIRKVLGASVGSLFGLLSKNFLRLIGLAFLIGAPLGWWAMHQWLEGFAYRTDIPWWTFAVAGAAVLVVTLLTVCGQTIRAATTDPIKSLRTE